MDGIKTGYRRSSIEVQACVCCGRAVMILWVTKRSWGHNLVLLALVVMLMLCCSRSECESVEACCKQIISEHMDD